MIPQVIAHNLHDTIAASTKRGEYNLKKVFKKKLAICRNVTENRLKENIKKDKQFINKIDIRIETQKYYLS